MLLVLYISLPADKEERSPQYSTRAHAARRAPPEHEKRVLQRIPSTPELRAHCVADDVVPTLFTCAAHVPVSSATSGEQFCDVSVALTAPDMDHYEFVPVSLHSMQLLVPRNPSDAIRTAALSNKNVVCPSDLLEALQRDAAAGRVVSLLDLGANVGSCTLAAAAAGHRALAVEPVPSNLAAIRANLRKNAHIFPSSARIAVLPIAVANASTAAEIVLDPRNIGNNAVAGEEGADYSKTIGSARRVPICIDRVDEYSDPRAVSDAITDILHDVRYLKIDIQGHELRALRGLERLLARGTVTAIFVEVLPYAIAGHGEDVFDMYHLLHKHGYHAIIFNGQPATLEDWQRVFTPSDIGNRFYFVDFLVLKDGVKFPPV